MQYVITMGFMALDFLSGMTKAVCLGELRSTKMRQGLFHKSALILCMVLGVGVDEAQRVMDIGFSVPVSSSICIYIVLMEISSILENICQLNPELMPEKLRLVFGQGRGTVHKDESGGS